MLGIYIILLWTILQARLQQYMNQEIPDVQDGFRKGRGTRDQIANIRRIIEKAREFQKNIYLCFTDYTKAFFWVTTNSGKFFKRWEYQTTLPASWETHMQVKKQCNWTWNNRLVQNWERSTSAIFYHPTYLTYMQSTSWKMPGCVSPRIAGRNINNLRYADDTSLMVDSKEELKSLLMRVKEKSEKAGLKLNIQNKTKTSTFKKLRYVSQSPQFSLVAQLCPTPWDPMNCSTPGLPVHH